MSRRHRVARAIRATWGERRPWDSLDRRRKQTWLEMADSALAAIDRESEMEKKSRLVEDWRWVLLKSHSMKLAALASAGAGWAVSNLDTIGAVVALAPPEVRSFIPLPVMFLVFGTILAVRLWKQKK